MLNRTTVLCLVLALAAGATWGAGAAPVHEPPAPEPSWADAFAQEVYQAWLAREPMPQLSARRPEASLADGYAVQERFVARVLRACGIGAYKAAVVGQAGQASLGIDAPVTGVIAADGVLETPEDAVIRLADFPNRAVETEIGYSFTRTVSEPVADTDALRALVATVFPVIEVPGGLTDEAHPATAADLAAWNGNARGIIVGTRLGPDDVDPDTVPVVLTRDGEVINTAQGSDAAGGQWATLLKTVNNLVERGYVVRPEHVVINGALGAILPAEPGAYRADYGPLGVICFDVVPE